MVIDIKRRRRVALRIQVHDEHPGAMHGQAGGEVDGSGGLPDAALLVGDRDDPARRRPRPPLAARPRHDRRLGGAGYRRIGRRVRKTVLTEWPPNFLTLAACPASAGLGPREPGAGTDCRTLPAAPSGCPAGLPAVVCRPGDRLPRPGTLRSGCAQAGLCTSGNADRPLRRQRCRRSAPAALFHVKPRPAPVAPALAEASCVRRRPEPRLDSVGLDLADSGLDARSH